MGIGESVRVALEGLRANKMRSLLTMLGIIIGISAVIGILTVGSGLTGSITVRLVAESSAPVGSSAKSSAGRLASARAMATRCFWPPDSSPGWWPARSLMPTCSSSSLARAARWRPGTPA